MKHFFPILIAICLVTPVLKAGVIIDLETPAGANFIVANPGDPVSLDTLLTTTAGEQVGSLEYTVSFTPIDWVLANRSYSINGWDTAFFDLSTPPEGAGPTVVTPALYAPTPAIADFAFNNSLDFTHPQFGIGVSGPDVPVETFTLNIPGTTPNGLYLLTLTPISAFDGSGFVDLSAALAGPSVFQLYLGISPPSTVPEPSSAILMILLLGSAAFLGSKRLHRTDS